MAMNPFLMQMMRAAQVAAKDPSVQMSIPVSNAMPGIKGAVSAVKPIDLANQLEIAGNARLDSAEAQMAQIAGMMPPKKRGAMRPGESGLVGVGMLLANLLGADKAGIAQAAQGYMGARQQTADLDNENALNEYAAKRENARMMAEIEMNKAQRLMSKANEVKIARSQAVAERVKREDELRKKSEDAIARAEQHGFRMRQINAENIGKVGLKPSQYRQQLEASAAELASLGDVNAMAKAKEFADDYEREYNWDESYFPLIKKQMEQLTNENTSGATRVRALKNIQGLVKQAGFGTDKLDQLFGSEEYMQLARETTAWEKVQNSIVGKNNASADASKAMAKLSTARAIEIERLLPLKENKYVMDTLLVDKKISEIDDKMSRIVSGDNKFNEKEFIEELRLGYIAVLKQKESAEKKASELRKAYDPSGSNKGLIEALDQEAARYDAEYKRLYGVWKSAIDSRGKPSAGKPAGATPPPAAGKQDDGFKPYGGGVSVRVRPPSGK